MMTNEDVLKETRKCTTCGLCVSLCPMFFLSTNKHEADSPRGRIKILQGHLSGRIDIDEMRLSDISNCLCCMNCEMKCYMLVDFFGIFSELNESYSDIVVKKIEESKKVLAGKRNNYILALIERFQRNISMNFSSNKTIAKGGDESNIIFVDGIDYMFSKREVDKQTGKEKCDILLMGSGSGILEYANGFRRIGEQIARKNLMEACGKRIFFLSRRDYIFYKKIFGKVNRRFAAYIPIKGKPMEINCFGTFNLIFNEDKIEIIRRIIEDLPKEISIDCISRYNELKSWSKNRGLVLNERTETQRRC